MYAYVSIAADGTPSFRMYYRNYGNYVNPFSGWKDTGYVVTGTNYYNRPGSLDGGWIEQKIITLTPTGMSASYDAGDPPYERECSAVWPLT